MAREGLYEESASTLKSVQEAKLNQFFKVVAIVFFVLVLVAGFLSFRVIGGAVDEMEGLPRFFVIVTWTLLILALLGVGLVFWFVRNRLNVSYDYAFVEDELRVTKVYNGRRRKYLVTLQADHMLRLGWCDRESYQNALRGLDGKPIRLTPNKTPAEGKTFVYILYSDSISKKVYVLECREALLEHLVFAAGRNKLEK